MQYSIVCKNDEEYYWLDVTFYDNIELHIGINDDMKLYKDLLKSLISGESFESFEGHDSSIYIKYEFGTMLLGSFVYSDPHNLGFKITFKRDEAIQFVTDLIDVYIREV